MMKSASYICEKIIESDPEKKCGFPYNEQQAKALETWLATIEAGFIPWQSPDFAGDIYKSMTVIRARRHITRNYNMWAMVDRLWTSELAKRLKILTNSASPRILEVFSGAGWLAKAMQSHGCQVTATDVNPFGKHIMTTIVSADARDAIRRFYADHDCLLLSWPPYDKPIAYECLLDWDSKKPVIYIGEGVDGCTADDSFHKRLAVYESMKIPTWPAIHDQVFIGQSAV